MTEYRATTGKKLYEIFQSHEPLLAKNRKIDVILGYPDGAIKTYRYRADDQLKKYEGTDWAAIVGEDLIAACNDMSEEERLIYFNPVDLRTKEYLEEHGWFPPFTDIS